MPLHESDGPKPDDDREPSLHDSTPVRAAAMVMGASLAEGAEGRKSSRPPALDAAPNPITLLRALQRRWILALSVGILGAAAAGIAAYCVVPPPKLTACSRLNICAYLPRIIFETGEQRAVYTTYQKTQVALIKSRRALQAALGKAEVAGLATVKEHADAVEWLEEELKVSLPGGAEILEISLSGKRAEDLAILVNAVTDSYLKMIEKVEHAERTERAREAQETLREVSGRAGGQAKEAPSARGDRGFERQGDHGVEAAVRAGTTRPRQEGLDAVALGVEEGPDGDRGVRGQGPGDARSAGHGRRGRGARRGRPWRRAVSGPDGRHQGADGRHPETDPERQ